MKRSIVNNSYITNVGMQLLIGDLVVLIFKQCWITGKNAFYLGYTEIYMCNIFLWMFVIKNYRYWLVCIFCSITILNIFNFYYMKDEEFIDNCATSFNSMIGSTLIMWNWDKEAKENLEGKAKLKEREINLKNILEIFPSGIIFYNKLNGIFYQNKYTVVDKNKDIKSKKIEENEPFFRRFGENNNDSTKIFNSLFFKG